MSDNILKKYMEQVAIDKQNEDDSLPSSISPDSQILQDADYQAKYKKRLSELRNDVNSIEKQYESAMKKIRRVSEEDLVNDEKVKDCEIHNIFVRRAYCPECGAELISKLPPMFNPFTQERQCIHECTCGIKYNLDYAYPRLVLVDSENNEIFAHGE